MAIVRSTKPKHEMVQYYKEVPSKHFLPLLYSTEVHKGSSKNRDVINQTCGIYQIVNLIDIRDNIRWISNVILHECHKEKDLPTPILAIVFFSWKKFHFGVFSWGQLVFCQNNPISGFPEFLFVKFSFLPLQNIQVILKKNCFAQKSYFWALKGWQPWGTDGKFVYIDGFLLQEHYNTDTNCLHGYKMRIWVENW